MGTCFSCRSSTFSSASKSDKFDTVRLVHLSGYVEDFEHPVAVSHVAEKPDKQFVCTAAQLLSGGSTKPMRPEAVLEPGRVYFLLPYSALQADMSPLDLAALARRLTARARRPGPSSTLSPSPSRCSPARSPGRCGEAEVGTMMASFGARRSTRARSWKPILDPIREMSFHRRNESELHLQEVILEDHSFRIIE